MMSSYKKLKLDVTKIEPAIREFAGGRTVTGPTTKGRAVEYEIGGIDGELPALLHVFVREDGTTTLGTSVGKNCKYSVSLADHIVNRANVQLYEPKPLSLKGLDSGVWDVLLQLLEEEGFTLSEQPQQHGVRFKVSAGAVDTVFLHRYNSGAFLMQGKPWNVYGTVVSLLSELAEDKRGLIDAQLMTMSVPEVTSAGLLDELEQRLPAACARLGEAMKCMMAPALVCRKLKIELPDYSMFVFPVLRGLEGCIKQILLETGGYEVKKAEGFASYFARDALKISVRDKIGCRKTVSAVEELYSLYNQHRPGLLHADGVPEMSRLIESKEEANTLIDTVLLSVETQFRNMSEA